MTTFFTLTVRGTSIPTSADSRRTLHNETAGSPQGMAAARSFSDLSHQVFVPCGDAGAMGGTRPDELLFVDVWTDPAGLDKFFSNPEVGKQAGRMFSARDGALWSPAAGGFSVNLLTPSNVTKLYLGMIRVPVPSIERATQIFRASGEKNLADARRRGLISHQTFFKFAGPGAPAPELLGLDLWADLKGMGEHYGATMEGLGEAFAGKPVTSVWERGQGFNEW